MSKLSPPASDPGSPINTLRLRVTAIQPESTGTKTIFLERTDGQVLDYKAGQFLTFLFSFHHRELRRSYSLSTTPGIDPVAAITVKRVPNGEISRYMLDHLHTGDELIALPPAGRFTLDSILPPSLLFIAAGSGIVPIFSLLKAALSRSSEAHIVLISQQHDATDTPFRAQLSRMKATYGSRFQWIDLLSTRDGRLNNWRLEELLIAMLPRQSQPSGPGLPPLPSGPGLPPRPGLPRPPFAYLCGPSSFMRMVQFTLRLVGFPEETIKKENFTVEFVPSAPAAIDPSPKKITIYAGGKIWQYEAIWPQTILQAGLAHEVHLPYSCRGGRCSTCVAKCLKGKVKMTINEVLTEKDLREGLVLTCVGYAETDVELTFETGPDPA